MARILPVGTPADEWYAWREQPGASPSGANGGLAIVDEANGDVGPPAGANLQRLWTPWRAAYLNEPQPPGCFFCRLAAADPAEDATNLVLFREASAYLLLNRFPYNSGHVMVAPRAHIGDFTSMAPDLVSALFLLTQRVMAVLIDEYHAHGFNIGLNLGSVAGAGVPDHLHVHVVPRWAGDTNYMPVIGETKVLPESLEQTYDRLRSYFQ